MWYGILHGVGTITPLTGMHGDLITGISTTVITTTSITIITHIFVTVTITGMTTGTTFITATEDRILIM
jgi:hypothetical protein